MPQDHVDNLFEGGFVVQTVLQNVENFLAALKSSFSGLTQPANPVPGMRWYDTTAHILKIRNEANNGWLSVWDLANNKAPDADKIDGIHAATAATANMLLALNAQAKMPCDITGNAATADSAASADTATTANGVASGAVHQVGLSTATDTKTTTSSTDVTLLFSGGSYGFWPTFTFYYAGTPGSAEWNGASSGDNNIYKNLIRMKKLSGGSAEGASAKQLYITSSPPNDMGDGEIPYFMFGVINNATGIIESLSSAPDGPWHYNGPTIIEPDLITADGRKWQEIDSPKSLSLIPNHILSAIQRRKIVPAAAERITYNKKQYCEITQDIKNADMHLIPHPFEPSELVGKTVVLIDPVADLTWQLTEAFKHDYMELHKIIHKDQLRIDNIPLPRKGPPGVVCCAAKWKNSK